MSCETRLAANPSQCNSYGLCSSARARQRTHRPGTTLAQAHRPAKVNGTRGSSVSASRAPSAQQLVLLYILLYTLMKTHTAERGSFQATPCELQSVPRARRIAVLSCASGERQPTRRATHATFATPKKVAARVLSATRLR